MNRRHGCVLFVTTVVLLSLLTAFATAQQYSDNLMKGMKWRLVGPFRGGRVLAVTGVVGDPYTYYFGGVAGGVWRTSDGGDHLDTAYRQAAALPRSAPSRWPNPITNVIYVGTGESCIRGNISYGDGVYKSTDGGKTLEERRA